ncbi:MAG TPA: hypothetical protein VKQ54_12550 [Caulobacteraceae bacterium]|nr:hypothetical protein [Caulobacteraceae bacterium]
MKHLFAGALALSVLLAGAASAQTYQARPDQPGGYQQDQHPGYDRGQQYQDNRDHQTGDQRYGETRGYDRYRHDDGRRSCYWRHHHHVCRWMH